MQFGPPGSLDVLAPSASVSDGGAAAVAFGIADEDNPVTASAFVALRSGRGRLSPAAAVPNAQQVLDVGFAGSTLWLLTGSSASGEACCSSAGVVPMGPGGRFGRGRALVAGLAGATVGRLVPSRDGLLAAIATERGVWVTTASRSGRFGATHRLAGAGAHPIALHAAVLGGRRDIVVWGAANSTVTDANRIVVAARSSRGAPGRPRVAVRVRGAVDELGLAAGPRSPTLAWVQSSYDRRGNYHSEVVVADLRSPLRTVSFPVAGTIASGLTFAADRRGDQVLAWRACTWTAACTVRASVRLAGKRFGRPTRLGSIDATETPALAVSPSGPALLGWIEGGHVMGSTLRRGAVRFSAPYFVSRTTYAADLALRYGPGREAIAAWSQGTLAPSVVGAIYSSR